MSETTQHPLAQHLAQARQNQGIVTTLNKTSLYLPTACTKTEAEELQTISTRPPVGTTVLKYGSRSFVGSHTLTNGKKIVLKYYHTPTSIIRSLNYRLRGTRAKQSWIGAIGLLHIGIPTPRPLFLTESNRALSILNNRSMIATEMATGTPLHLFYDKNKNNNPLIQAITGKLKTYFQTMADLHIAHGDLKASNILISPKGHITFIDLDAVKFLPPGETWQKARSRDKRVFLHNWANNPAALEQFRPVIT